MLVHLAGRVCSVSGGTKWQREASLGWKGTKAKEVVSGGGAIAHLGVLSLPPMGQFPGQWVSADTLRESTGNAIFFFLYTERSIMLIKHQKSDSDRFYLCNSRLDHRNYGCSSIRVGGDKPRLGRSKHKCQVQPQVKKKRPPSTAARPGGCDQAHSPRPSISFPGTNYPDVRDLTHKLRTAGEFSGSNHTSVLLAPNNPQCLTHPPPSASRLRIDQLPSAGSWRSPRLSGPLRGKKNSRRWREKRARD